MRALTWILLTILALLLLFCMTGCTTVPTVPEKVTVIVERYKPLPAWATERLHKPVRADGRIESVLGNENARGEVIDFANCRSMLLAKLDKGEAADRKDCEAQK